MVTMGTMLINGQKRPYFAFWLSDEEIHLETVRTAGKGQRMATGSIARFDVKYIRFPEIMNGVILGMTDYIPEKDKFLVVIDSSRPETEQRETLKHELVHVFLRHNKRNMETELLEHEAREKAERMTDEQLDFLLSFADSIEHLPGHYDQNYNYFAG